MCFGPSYIPPAVTREAPSGVHAFVLDIEGTTTPIAFVTGLFPFARASSSRIPASSPRQRAELREPMRRLHEE